MTVQELSITKDEGQGLLQAATMWANKCMSGWLPDRRQAVQGQVRELQARWERLLAQLADTRAIVEGGVAQWQEARDSCEQVMRWLKDMERRLADAEPRSDLAEKRALLQKVKVCCLLFTAHALLCRLELSLFIVINNGIF